MCIRDRQPSVHGLVRAEHACETPSHGPRHGGRAQARSQGALEVRDGHLPRAVGAGRALPARAPHDR
eukprot:466325-Alexandrium_andersonii.AAC.1